MSNNQFGNNLLYLLSEKKSLKWGQFRKYMEYLYQENKSALAEQAGLNSEILNSKDEDSFQKQSGKFRYLARNMSALAYLDVGGKVGETIIKIAPPMLSELPFMKSVFLLTGARSPSLLKAVKKIFRNHPEIEIEIRTHSSLPDTILIKPENKTALQKFLEETIFQGSRLSDYIKISESPPSWNILEFVGNIKTYEESLENDWFSGNKADIKEIFNTDSLQFKTFNPDRDILKNELSLVKIFHQEHFYKYYLFSKQDQKKVEVQLDWGKFLILAKQFRDPVLEYNKRAFELRSFLRLPFIFERGLVLLSGSPPRTLEKKKRKDQVVQEEAFVFKNVPNKIATLIADKLGQELK